MSDGEVFAEAETCVFRGGNRFVVGIGNDQSADARDRMAKPYQLLTVELVSPAEVVDDFGDGFSGLGMTLVVGQLVVLDGGAVLVFAL